MNLQSGNFRAGGRCHRWVVGLLAVLMLAGSHWTVLQSLAWASMFLRFAMKDSWSVAARKTFDGRHPCPLCFQVRQGQQQEQRQGRSLPLKNPAPGPELFCEARPVAWPVPPVVHAGPPAWPPDFCSDHIETPRPPPPRSTTAVL